MNFFSYLQNPDNWYGPDKILNLLAQHLGYTAAAVLLAAIVAIPVGILIGHTGRGRFLAIGLTHGGRAIPTLGLLFLAVMLLGTGVLNVVVVLALLAVPPMLAAAAAGVRGADPESVHTARALGMTGGQILSKVELPLALPLVISGVRRATLQVVATATVAAFAGAGGLGRLLTRGQQQNDYPQMFAGALLVAALAIALHLLLGLVGWLAARRMRPRRRTDASTALAPA